ncbi:MAG: amidase [Desulfatibacillum sp.]|nr:amidase [Desulfatibacillum sp.]
MPDFNEIAFMDATAQAQLVRNKEVTPLELVQGAINRIEKLNPQLNAVITPMYEQALEEAKGPLPEGPFTGVPFLLKDIGAMAKGVQTCLGSRILKGMFFPDHDSELTVRLRKAGFIIVGKTNTPEFGILPTTEPVAFGPTHNPWDLDRTPGGSSGGAAAAVASGMVSVAHGNDGGGSIRIPASCCGVFGLKPTRARNPVGPDFGDLLSGLISEHALTRSVRDSAAILDATSGPDLGDPYWAPPNTKPFLEEVGANPGKLRIAVDLSTHLDEKPHPDCVRAVEETVRLCRELGHDVKEASPTVQGAPADLFRAFDTLWTSNVASTINAIVSISKITPSTDFFEPFTMALHEIGSKQSASDYLRALTVIQRFARDIARFLVDYDLLLTPTLGEPPVLLGELDAPEENPMAAWKRIAKFTPYTAKVNATGQPAMSVPLFWNSQNLPIGSHFVGRFGDEATLFRLASQLEQACPWAQRRPPVCA